MGPVTKLATLLPHQNESLMNFARQLREVFYQMPQSTRNGYNDREIVINIVRTHMPSVWLSIHDHVQKWTTAEVVEETTRRAQIITRQVIEPKIYSTPSTTVQLHGTAAPFYNLNIKEATSENPSVTRVEPPDATTTVPNAATFGTISDPRNDDRDVHTAQQEGYAAKERNNKCFNCGKDGHLAQDCTEEPKFPRKTQPGGKKVTLEGTLLYDNNTKFPRIRSAFQKWKGQGKGKDRVYMEGHSDGCGEKSPAERLDDTDLDQELTDLFEAMDTAE